MLRLNLEARPKRLDLGHDVVVHVLPLSTAVMSAARRDPQVQAVLKAMSQDELDAIATASDAELVVGNKEDLGIAMARALARRVITAWEGVGDEDGNPVDVTPERVDALLDLWAMFEAFQQKYMAAAGLVEAEKNGSAPSPSGTTAGATDTAKPAQTSARSAPQG